MPRPYKFGVPHLWTKATVVSSQARQEIPAPYLLVSLYHPQAEAALSSLNTEERNRILASVRKLAEFGLCDPDIAPLRERVDKEPAYVLRSDTDFRVVFTASQNRITVLDVLNKYFAERYG